MLEQLLVIFAAFSLYLVIHHTTTWLERREAKRRDEMIWRQRQAKAMRELEHAYEIENQK